MRAALPIPLLLAAAMPATPSLGWDAPEAIVGEYALVQAESPEAGRPCEIELLAALAHEFEGIWYVARPLHYEPNRDACRLLGLDDVIAWSGDGGSSLWVLAEGRAGFMEFRPDGGRWRLVKSGHKPAADLVLRRAGSGE